MNLFSLKKKGFYLIELLGGEIYEASNITFYSKSILYKIKCSSYQIIIWKCPFGAYKSPRNIFRFRIHSTFQNKQDDPLMSNTCLLLIMVQINVTDVKLFRNTQSAA